MQYKFRKIIGGENYAIREYFKVHLVAQVIGNYKTLWSEYVAGRGRQRRYSKSVVRS
jgi:hypothetical protein